MKRIEKIFSKTIIRPCLLHLFFFSSIKKTFRRHGPISKIFHPIKTFPNNLPSNRYQSKSNTFHISFFLFQTLQKFHLSHNFPSVYVNQSQMKRKIQNISNQSIQTRQTMFLVSFLRFNKSHQLFRTRIGVLIFRPLFRPTRVVPPYSQAIDDNSLPNSSSLLYQSFRAVHTFGKRIVLSVSRSAIYDQQRSPNISYIPRRNSLSSIDSRFPRHVRRYRTLLLRVVFQSMLQPSVRWQHTRLTGKKDYSREKNLNVTRLSSLWNVITKKKYSFLLFRFFKMISLRLYDNCDF